LNLYEQFCQRSDLSSLKKCIEVHLALLAQNAYGVDRHTSAKLAATRPSLNLGVHHILIQLARAHEARFVLVGESCDIDFAIKYGQDAVDFCEAEKALCPTVMVHYARILGTKAMQSILNGPDFDSKGQSAEGLCRQAVTLLRSDSRHPLLPFTHNVLSWTLFRRYEQSGNVECLEEALSLQRLALAQMSTFHCSDRHWHLRCLGVELRSRFERFVDPRDLDESISVFAEAMELCSPAHVDRIRIVCGMVQGLARKYTVSGAAEYLNQAQDLGRKVLSVPYPQASGCRSTGITSLLSAMSVILMLRYETGGCSADIHESVNLSREVLLYCPLSDRDRWVYTHNLVSALVFLFEVEGDLGNLEEAALLIRQIPSTLPDSHPGRFSLKKAEATVKARRFDAMRDINDLNDAIDLVRDTTVATARNFDPAPILQLATHLCNRFQVLHQADDVEQAILMLTHVLQSIPQGYIQRLDVVHQLSKALLLRSQHVTLDTCEDIDHAIDEITCHKEELVRSMFGPESLRTLAACFFTRYRRIRDVNDVDRAFTIMVDLVQTVMPGQLDRFSCLVYAAELYLEDTPHHDVAMALELVSTALVEPQRDVRARVQGVKSFLDLVETRYYDIFTTSPPKVKLQLLDVYASAIALLPRIAFFGVQLHSRLQSLSVGQSVALTAASHALALSLPERALEILEQGRAIFWTHSLRLRSAFDDVPEHFRSQLLAIARKLERVSNVSRPRDNRDPQSFEDEAAERRQQSEEFNSLAEQVRCLPGMDRFLLHDNYSTIAKVAERGPVVVLVSSTLACHAIVIKPSGEALGIPLNVLTESWLISSGAVWRSAVTEARSIARDVNSRKMVKSANPRKSRSVEAEGILRRLWESVVWPVISMLGIKVY
jgi:hypothetical protein